MCNGEMIVPMRGIVGVLSCTIVLAGGLGTPGAEASSPRAAVTALIHAQDAAYNARDWKLFYSYFSPRYKSACPYARWEKADSTDPSNKFPEHTVVTNIRFAGATTAYVAYKIYWHTTVVEQVFPGYPDKYVRIGGRWYDEIDGHTTCP